MHFLANHSVKSVKAPKATQNNDPNQTNIPLASAHRDPLTYWQERNAMFLFSRSKFQQNNIKKKRKP